jgi:hypothetical protein
LAERTKALEALEDDEGPPDLAKEETDSTSECSSPSKSTIGKCRQRQIHLIRGIYIQIHVITLFYFFSPPPSQRGKHDIF